MPGWSRSVRAGMPFLRAAGVTVPDYLAARRAGDGSVERRFHEQLLLRNGVYRTTGPHRLDATFPGLIEAARRHESRPVRVLDVACSMGVSTVELHEAIRRAGVECETLGTDLLLAARYVSRGGEGILFDADREVLQVDVGNWATPWRLRRSDRLFRPGRTRRARSLMGDAGREFREALDSTRPPFEVTDVPLLHRSTEGVTGLRFTQESLFAPEEPGPFDLIRAANILNGDYFPPETLRSLLEGLRARLAERGTLLVARNLPGESITRATYFRHEAGRLVAFLEINGGSEVAALLDAPADPGGPAADRRPPAGA